MTAWRKQSPVTYTCSGTRHDGAQKTTREFCKNIITEKKIFHTTEKTMSTMKRPQSRKGKEMKPVSGKEKQKGATIIRKRGQQTTEREKKK